jgi:hypothetical protein
MTDFLSVSLVIAPESQTIGKSRANGWPIVGLAAAHREQLTIDLVIIQVLAVRQLIVVLILAIAAVLYDPIPLIAVELARFMRAFLGDKEGEEEEEREREGGRGEEKYDHIRICWFSHCRAATATFK